MATLGELARLIRSKNAWPYMLTFDVMFDDGGELSPQVIDVLFRHDLTAARLRPALPR